MRKNKSIAIFMYDSSLIGGAEMISLKLLKEFNKSYDVLLISLFQKNEKPILDIENIKHVVLSPKFGSIPKNLVRYSLALRNILKEYNVDLLLGITAGINSICALGSMGLNTQWIYCEHSNLENQTYGKLHFFRQMIGAYLSNKIVVLTERDIENFKRVFRIKSNNILSIPNYFEQEKTLKEYDSSSKKIISVGRLVDVKQFDHVIDISKNIFLHYPDWEWHIYGTGNLEGMLNSRIIELGLDRNLKLKGAISNLLDIMNEYSFLVMTSKYEGFPLALLEAQSQKLPIISYNCPTGPSEIISHNINGCLVLAQNKEELKEKVIELMSSRVLREYYSKNTFIKLDIYSKDNILRKWYSLFNYIF